MTSTGRHFLLLLPLAVLLAVVCITAAAASPPTPASGTVGNTSSTFNSIRAEGGNLSARRAISPAFTGCFTRFKPWSCRTAPWVPTAGRSNPAVPKHVRSVRGRRHRPIACRLWARHLRSRKA
jgi:hypothetical protein